MQRSDMAAFGRELIVTAEVFGDTLSEARTLGYFEALMDLPLDAVLAGLRHARRSTRFFPKPAEVRELVQGSVEDRAREAWRCVLGALEHVGTYESVDFGDPLIHAAVEALGGWHQAWAWERADGPELLGYERDFVSLYRLYAQRGLSRRPLVALLGQHSLHNRQVGAALRGQMPAETVIMLDAGGHPVERKALAPAPDQRAIEASHAD